MVGFAMQDAALRNAKAQAKSRRSFDERGHYLEISPSGGRADHTLHPLVGIVLHLRKRTIEMGISTVDDKVLCGSVSRLI